MWVTIENLFIIYVNSLHKIRCFVVRKFSSHRIRKFYMSVHVWLRVFVFLLFIFFIRRTIFVWIVICHILRCRPLYCFHPSTISIKENLQALYTFRQLRFDNPRLWAASYMWCSIGSYKSTSSIGSLKLRTEFLISSDNKHSYRLICNWFQCKHPFLTPSFFIFVYLTVAREPYNGVMHKALYIHSIHTRFNG
jgi:hypothetical protein